MCLAAIGIDDPDYSHTRVEPFGNLREDVAGPIIGRQNLGDKIRSERRVAAPLNLRRPVAPQKSKIGSADRVRVGCNLETRVLAEYRAQIVCAYEGAEQNEEVCLDSPMVRARRFADDEEAADELRRLTRQVHALQLFRRHDPGHWFCAHRHSITRLAEGYKRAGYHFSVSLRHHSVAEGARTEKTDDCYDVPGSYLVTTFVPETHMIDDMGIFRTTISVAHMANPTQKRILSDVMVDTGSEYNWIPREVLEALAVEPQRVEAFETADGRVLHRPIGYAWVFAGGRSAPTVVVFADAGDMVLLGAQGLEVLNLRIDLGRKELIPAGPLPVAVAA
jgi:predicted aspartyl protease